MQSTSGAQAPTLNLDFEPWLSPAEAARYTGLHQRTLRRAIQRGQLRAYRLGRILRYRRADLDRLFEAVDGSTVAGTDLDGFIAGQTAGRSSPA